MNPDTLRYTKTHEWASREGDVVTVGITKFAADQLSDVTFVGLPKVGTKVTAGKDFGQIETVKAVNDLYSPVSGEVVAVNDAIAADTNRLVQAPFGEGWLIKIKLAAGATLDDLLSAEQYTKQIESEAH